MRAGYNINRVNYNTINPVEKEILDLEKNDKIKIILVLLLNMKQFVLLMNYQKIIQLL